jgi:hypothetical protein
VGIDPLSHSGGEVEISPGGEPQQNQMQDQEADYGEHNCPTFLDAAHWRCPSPYQPGLPPKSSLGVKETSQPRPPDRQQQ